MKKYLNLLILILIVVINIPVEVHCATALEGNTASHTACVDKSGNPLTWCYWGTGYRFSIYTYNGKDLDPLVSIDITSNNYFKGEEAYVANSSPVGKVSYTSGKNDLNWTDKIKILDIESNVKKGQSAYFGSNKLKVISSFPSYFNSGVDFERIKKEILSWLSLNTKDSTKVQAKIKSNFGIEISPTKLSNTYITIEPTIYFYNTDTGASYYGTPYELLNIPELINKKIAANTEGGESLYGMNFVLYHDFPFAINASNASDDKNNFVGTNDESFVRVVGRDDVPKLSTGTGEQKNRKGNSYLVSNYGYGIGVVWLGDYIKESSCKDLCKGKKERDLLNCAEEQCSMDTNGMTKEECIISCGYEKPKKFNCPADTKKDALDSICDEKVTAFKETCKIDGDYYMETCNEETTLYYPDLLGKNALLLNKKYSFPYIIYTTGVKTCTREFNYKLFEFDYAASDSDSSRQTLESELSKKYFSDDDDSGSTTYKYNEIWEELELNNSKNKYSLEWFSDENSKYYVSLKDDVDINLNEEGIATVKKNITNKKEYKSEVNGQISLTDELQTGLKIPFITDSASSKTNIVTIKKNSSNLNSTNKCMYQPSDSGKNLSCYAEVNYEGNGTSQKAKVKYNIIYLTKKNSESLEEIGNINNVKYSFKKDDLTNPIKLTTLTKNNLTVTVNYSDSTKIVKNLYLTDGDITTSCPATIVFRNDSCDISLNKTSDLRKVKVTKGSNIESVECKTASDNKTLSFSSGYVTIPITADNSHDTVICTATSNTGEVCRASISTGTCSVYESSQIDKISEYCTKYHFIDGYSTYGNCMDKCTPFACPKCPTEANNDEVKEWCSKKSNYETAGYENSLACVNDCSCTTGLGEYIFRPISLGKTFENKFKAFPNREAGSNWYGAEEKTEKEDFDEALFVITLDKKSIKDIIKDTSDTNKSIAYFPYEQLSSDNKNKLFTSNLITKFPSVFCKSSGSKECD